MSGMEVLAPLTNAPIAQWIECLIPIQKVVSSILTRRSIMSQVLIYMRTFILDYL